MTKLLSFWKCQCSEKGQFDRTTSMKNALLVTFMKFTPNCLTFNAVVVAYDVALVIEFEWGSELPTIKVHIHMVEISQMVIELHLKCRLIV